MEWHQAGYDRACWPCGCSGKPPSHRPTSSPLPSTTPALMLLGQWTGWQPHGCTGLDGINWLLCPPSGITVWADWPRDLRMQDKFHQKGLSRLRFSLKQTEEKQQLPMPNCLRRTISKQGPYILLRQGTSQVMNVGLPWPFQETLTLTDYRQINTQQ